MTSKIVERAKSYQSDTVPIDDPATLKTPCPKCGGVVSENYRRFACGACDFSIGKHPGSRTLEVEEVEQLLRDRTIGPLQGFISKMGRPFAAVLKITPGVQARIRLRPVERATTAATSRSTSRARPRWAPARSAVRACSSSPCRTSARRASGAGRSCDFRSGKVILQQPIERAQMEKLLAEGRTDVLRAFVSNRTRRKFSAFLAKKPDGAIGFEFEPREAARRQDRAQVHEGDRAGRRDGEAPAKRAAKGSAKTATAGGRREARQGRGEAAGKTAKRRGDQDGRPQDHRRRRRRRPAAPRAQGAGARLTRPRLAATRSMQRALIVVGLVLLARGHRLAVAFQASRSAGCPATSQVERENFSFHLPARHLDRRVDRHQRAHLAVPQVVAEQRPSRAGIARRTCVRQSRALPPSPALPGFQCCFSPRRSCCRRSCCSWSSRSSPSRSCRGSAARRPSGPCAWSSSRWCCCSGTPTRT